MLKAAKCNNLIYCISSAVAGYTVDMNITTVHVFVTFISRLKFQSRSYPELCLHNFRRKSYTTVAAQVPAMKILNVAEKNDAAKNIASHLSGGNSQRVRRRQETSKSNQYHYL